MVKKTIVAVIGIFLIASVFVGAYHYSYGRYYYPGRYGLVIDHGSPYYAQSPLYSYPYSYQYYTSSPAYAYPYSYGGAYRQYPSYSYPYYSPRYYPYEYSPLSSRYIYRYGAPTQVTTAPTTEYAAPVGPRGMLGQVCGMFGNIEYGCEYGLVCDYTKNEQQGAGICSVQS